MGFFEKLKAGLKRTQESLAGAINSLFSGFSEIDDIFGAVGYGGMASVYVVTKLLEEKKQAEATAVPRTDELPTVEEHQAKEAQRRASAVMAPIFKESDPVLVRALYHEAVAELESFAPAAAKVLEDAEVDALAHLSFPSGHRVKIRTNNVQERMNCELKRRTKVVQAFPSTDSVMRLLGGIVDEINADWESGRLFMSRESLAPVLAIEKAENRTNPSPHLPKPMPGVQTT